MSPDLPARVPEGDGTGASVLADPLEGPHQVRLAVAPALLCMYKVKNLIYPSYGTGMTTGKLLHKILF